MPTLRIDASLLNVRQAPDPAAAVLDRLPRDSRVEKLAASPDGEWFQVRTPAGASGWIAARYALEVPAAAAAAPPAPVVLGVTASLLNLRSAAEPGAPVVAKLPRGTRVEQTGVSADGAWLAVRTADGTAGWLSAQFAEPVAAGAPAAAAQPAGDALPWMAVARGEMGVAEVPGEKNNPRILEYHATTQWAAHDDETPWCSAFANWCMKQVGIKGSGLANARSWLDWGRHVQQPVPGCVVVLRRGTSPTSGHVAFFVERQGDRLQVLGGNQGDRVKLSSYPATDVLGYRLPPG